MSIASYEFFKALEGRVMYTSFSRPSELIDLDGGKAEPCQHRLTIKEFLAGYGFESRKSDNKIREAEERARQAWECARVIAAHATNRDLLLLSDEDRKKARSANEGWLLQPGQLQPPDEAVAAKLIQTLPLQQIEGGGLSGKLSKYDVQFLTGGWLETFFWGLVDTHYESLGVSDVRLGLEVGRCGDTSGNDFDVAFMYNLGLAMIECKSGGQEQDPGSDILFKVEAVTRQFRALRVKSFLATTSEFVLDKDRKKIKSALANRAAIYDCRILTLTNIRELAADAANHDRVKAALFGTEARQ